MRKISILFLLFVCAALPIFYYSKPAVAVEQISIFEVEDKSDTTVLANGDAKVKEVVTMSASAFANFRQRFPVLSTFIRTFKPANLPSQMENVDIKLDEGKNQITAEYILKGVSVNRGDYWEIDYFATEGVGKVNLSAQNKNVLVFNITGQVTQGMREVTTITIKLPDKAKEIKFDSDAKKITYKFLGGAARKNSMLPVLAGVFLVVGVLSFFLLKPKNEFKQVGKEQPK